MPKPEATQIAKAIHFIETFRKAFGGKPESVNMTREQHTAYLSELDELPYELKDAATPEHLLGVRINITKE